MVYLAPQLAKQAVAQIIEQDESTSLLVSEAAMIAPRALRHCRNIARSAKAAGFVALKEYSSNLLTKNAKISFLSSLAKNEGTARVPFRFGGEGEVYNRRGGRLQKQLWAMPDMKSFDFTKRKKQKAAYGSFE